MCSSDLYDHKLLKDGDEFWAGNVKLTVMHTPGHTPEHISFLLTDTAKTQEPVGIFTGDFVFVGDIGRPDLLEEAAGMIGTADAGARQRFRPRRSATRSSSAGPSRSTRRKPSWRRCWPASRKRLNTSPR